MAEEQPVLILPHGKKIVNLTPHPIRVIGENDQVILEIPRNTSPLRLNEERTDQGTISGVRVVGKSLSPAGGLPPQEEGTYYIVSLVIAQMYKRPDFLVPDDPVRDEEGRIIGCRRFARIL